MLILELLSFTTELYFGNMSQETISHVINRFSGGEGIKFKDDVQQQNRLCQIVKAQFSCENKDEATKLFLTDNNLARATCRKIDAKMSSIFA